MDQNPNQSTSEDMTHDLIVTGSKAQELLDNETFKATVWELNSQIVSGILGTNFPEQQKRDDLYMLYKAVQNIVNILEASAKIKPLLEEAEALKDDEEQTEETINEE